MPERNGGRRKKTRKPAGRTIRRSSCPRRPERCVVARADEPGRVDAMVRGGREVEPLAAASSVLGAAHVRRAAARSARRYQASHASSTGREIGVRVDDRLGHECLRSSSSSRRRRRGGGGAPPRLRADAPLDAQQVPVPPAGAVPDGAQSRTCGTDPRQPPRVLECRRGSRRAAGTSPPEPGDRVSIEIDAPRERVSGPARPTARWSTLDRRPARRGRAPTFGAPLTLRVDSTRNSGRDVQARNRPPDSRDSSTKKRGSSPSGPIGGPTRSRAAPRVGWILERPRPRRHARDPRARRLRPAARRSALPFRLGGFLRRFKAARERGDEVF
jgi:hypothetical protein